MHLQKKGSAPALHSLGRPNQQVYKLGSNQNFPSQPSNYGHSQNQAYQTGFGTVQGSQSTFNPSLLDKKQELYPSNDSVDPYYANYNSADRSHENNYTTEEFDQWNAQQQAGMYTQQQIDDWNVQLHEQGYSSSQIAEWNSHQQVYTQTQIDEWYHSARGRQ